MDDRDVSKHHAEDKIPAPAAVPPKTGWRAAEEAITPHPNLAVLPTLLIYTFTSLALIALFGTMIAGLIPVWIYGVQSILLVPLGITIFLIIARDDQADVGGETLTNLWESPRRSSLAAAIVLVTTLGEFALIHWVATSVPLVPQCVILGFFFLIFCTVAAVLAAGRGREWMLRLFSSFYGRYAALSILIAAILLMTLLFGSLTFVLQRHDLIHLYTPSGAKPTVDTSSAFYLWHFLDSVPLLEVPRTLHWAVPMKYQDWAGVLVICYKVAVFVPLVAALIQLWRTTSGTKE
jgi:hypothetical protein